MDPTKELVTKADLAAAESRILETTKADLAAAESRIIEEVTDRLTEMLRGIETSLLRAFHSYSQSVEVRMRRIEADSRNIDAESKGRIEALEARVLELELRLPPSSAPPSRGAH
ncbi:MAG: hypothetical protein IT165_26070 [Bryobacterales bacterium]|nr:hypothetical protein [Bryobacterales bacterium]